jgi:hypothetical protein
MVRFNAHLESLPFCSFLFSAGISSCMSSVREGSLELKWNFPWSRRVGWNPREKWRMERYWSTGLCLNYTLSICLGPGLNTVLHWIGMRSNMNDIIIASSAFILIYSVIYKMKNWNICQCWEVKMGTLGYEGCLAEGNAGTEWEICLLNASQPVTVAERSKEWTVFARADAGTMVSNPTLGMDV